MPLDGLWRAVSGYQAGFADHVVGAGNPQAGSIEVGPGLLRAITACGADLKAISLRQSDWRAGFDLRGKTWENGQRGGNE